jgi:hypothetical protein
MKPPHRATLKARLLRLDDEKKADDASADDVDDELCIYIGETTVMIDVFLVWTPIMHHVYIIIILTIIMDVCKKKVKVVVAGLEPWWGKKE